LAKAGIHGTGFLGMG